MKYKSCLYIALVLLFFGCSKPIIIHNTLPYEPRKILEPPARHVVVANGFDVDAQSFRDNKEEQFKLLINGALQFMALSIEGHSDIEVNIERDLSIIPGKVDSCMTSLMKMHDANYLVYIERFDIYFNQTDVVVTEDEDGKSREAYYDIISEIDYNLVARSGGKEFVPINLTSFHSTRNVISGLFAAGPNIVSNHEDAVEMTRLNVNEFLRNYFAGTDERFREISTSGDFGNLEPLLIAKDYQAALAFCEKYTNSPNKKTAARAFHYMAIIAEHMGDFEKTQEYLSRSYRIYRTPEVYAMMEDY